MSVINLMDVVRKSGVEEISATIFKPATYTVGQVEQLKEVNRHSNNHIDDRLIHLSTIAKLMQISAQDAEHGNIGGFDLHDCAQLGFFFEEELDNLSHVKRLVDDTRPFKILCQPRLLNI